MSEPVRRVAVSSIYESASMLEQYVNAEELAPLLDVLRELAKNPDDAALLVRLSEVFDSLGILQGAVLTYAPAVGGLLSDDPFSDSE